MLRTKGQVFQVALSTTNRSCLAELANGQLVSLLAAHTGAAVYVGRIGSRTTRAAASAQNVRTDTWHRGTQGADRRPDNVSWAPGLAPRPLSAGLTWSIFFFHCGAISGWIAAPRLGFRGLQLRDTDSVDYSSRRDSDSVDCSSATRIPLIAAA